MGKKSFTDFPSDDKRRERVFGCQPHCHPDCLWFPNMDCSVWSFDEDGVKHRADNKEFICGYDSHPIKNWFEPCPFYEERQQEQFLKSVKNGTKIPLKNVSQEPKTPSKNVSQSTKTGSENVCEESGKTPEQIVAEKIEAARKFRFGR